MSLETLFDPQTVFTSTGDPLLSPDTDFMNFVNPGSQNRSKAVQGNAQMPSFLMNPKGSGLKKSC